MRGRLICAQLIPHAVDFFTGKALEYEALDEDDEDLDLGDDDDASDEGVSSHYQRLHDSADLYCYPRRTRTRRTIYQHADVDRQNALTHLHRSGQMSIRKNANNSK